MGRRRKGEKVGKRERGEGESEEMRKWWKRRVERDKILEE
jgi:hypothetical protein